MGDCVLTFVRQGSGLVQEVALFLHYGLYASLRGGMSQRDIIGNMLCVIGDFPIELYAQRTGGKMASTDREGLPYQLASGAIDVPEVMTVRVHPSSPQKL